MFGCFVIIQPLSQFVTIGKDSFLIIIHNSTKKWIIWISQMQHWTHFKMPNSLSLSSYVNPSIEFSVLAKLLRYSDIVEMLTLIIWDISLKLWHGFCLTSIFRCWWSIADGRPLPSSSSTRTPSMKLQESARYSLSTSGSFILCSVYVGSSLNSCKKKVNASLLFSCWIWWAYNVLS